MARDLTKSDAINAITRMQSAALTIQERAERHVERIAGITDKVLPHLESMEPGEILNSGCNLERIDYVARRNYQFDQRPPAGGGTHIGLLTGQVAIQYKERFDPQE